MKIENIISQIEMNDEAYRKVACVMALIEGRSPSDSSVYLRLKRVKNKYVGSLKIISRNVRILFAQEGLDLDQLLRNLDNKCREKIELWRQTREV